MSEKTLPEYEAAASELQASGLAVTPAELQGLLAGMLSGGLSTTDKSWQPLIYDYTNDGMGWPVKAITLAESVLTVTTQELAGSGMALSLLLPADNADLFTRADAVSEWVNHFISGLGLVNVALQKAPDDVKEALADLEEIGKLGIDEDDDLREQADLLEQVIEHIKVCVLTIHAEYANKAGKASAKPTIH
jgi:yecA family protein